MLGGDGVRLWGSCQNQPPAKASSIGFPPVYNVWNWSALSEGQCHWLQCGASVAACGFLSFLGAPSACSLSLLGLAAPPRAELFCTVNKNAENTRRDVREQLLVVQEISLK